MNAKKMIARVLGVTTVTAALLIAGAGPAAAFDHGTCERIFGAGNVSTRTVRIDTGTAEKVDFGDYAHIGGVPYGTGVVCFGNTGRAAVVGRVFADSSTTITVKAQVTYFERSGATLTTSHSVTGKDAASRLVNELSPGGSWDHVRIRLFRGTTLVTQQTLSRTMGSASNT